MSVEAKPAPMPTFGRFINEHYAPWARENLPANDFGNRLPTLFPQWLKEPLDALSAPRIAAWHRDQLQTDANPAKIDRQLQALGACLDKAVEWRIIDSNPLQEADLQRDRESLVELFMGGIGHTCLREGWAPVGANWTWTMGNSAITELRGVNRNSDHMFKLVIDGIFRPTPSAFQRINVVVNDTTIGMVACRGPAYYEFFVSRKVLQGRELTQISLRLPDARRPIDFNKEASDTRSLALRVAKMELAPQTPVPKEGNGRVIPGVSVQGLFEQRSALQDMVSLGYNCEFGFVQRFAGAEPMSLFRWTDSPAAKLIVALDDRLAGLGIRDALDIQVSPEGEYVAEDKSYGFRHHTFIKEGDGVTLDRVQRNEFLRVGVLTKTLLEELRERKKLFVYHDGGRSNLPDVQQLLKAVRQYGNNYLLWLVPAPDPSLSGSAKEIEPGLIAGYVGGFQEGRLEALSPFLPSWLAAAAAAHKIWTEARATQPQVMGAQQPAKSVSQ